MTRIGAAQTDDERPGTIDAIPVRRPGRIVAAVVAGTIGALIIAVLSNGLILLGVSDIWQYIIKGGVIILAVAIDKLRTR